MLTLVGSMRGVACPPWSVRSDVRYRGGPDRVSIPVGD